MFLRRSLTVAAVAAALLGAGAGFAQPAPTVTAGVPRRPRWYPFNGAVASSSWAGHTYLNHGPTAAQIKRAAAKRRNIAKHKARMRGAK